jgi:hypothetical protein
MKSVFFQPIARRLKPFLRIIHGIVWGTSTFSSLGMANPLTTLAEKDLAIVLPAASSRGIFAAKSEAPQTPLFKREWYETVRTAFQKTSVGDSLELENTFADWRLVSLRVVPCSPLRESLQWNADVYCWPEVRLVWQPVVTGGAQVISRITDHYADDRAMHVLYDVSPTESGKANEAQTLLNKIRNAPVSQFSPLNSTELASFQTLQKYAAKNLLSAVLSLRGQVNSADAWKAIEVRPETFTDSEEDRFLARLESFLGRFAPSKM